MINVSARCWGFILFFESHKLTSFLPACPECAGMAGRFLPRDLDKLFASCFLGCENPAFTILKNKSLSTSPPLILGVILIIPESTFGLGQKHFFETYETISALA